MRTKRVNRYYCDFCKKSGCSAPAMVKHEKGCTMNPDRKCRLCDGGHIASEIPVPIPSDFFVLGRDFADYNMELLGPLLKAYVDDVRDAVDGCPVCALATFRQSGIDMPLLPFKYKEEVADWWSERNAAERDMVCWP